MTTVIEATEPKIEPNIFEYPHRRYLVQYQHPNIEVKHCDITMPTVCDCGESLPVPQEAYIRNRDRIDSGGLWVICPKCAMQYWQVIDTRVE